LKNEDSRSAAAPITVSKMAGPIVGFPNMRLKPSAADLQPVTAQNPTDAEFDINASTNIKPAVFVSRSAPHQL
jgi:hypothetical protein